MIKIAKRIVIRYPIIFPTLIAIKLTIILRNKLTFVGSIKYDIIKSGLYFLR